MQLEPVITVTSVMRVSSSNGQESGKGRNKAGLNSKSTDGSGGSDTLVSQGSGKDGELVRCLIPSPHTCHIFAIFDQLFFV